MNKIKMIGIIIAMEDEFPIDNLDIKNVKIREINNQKFYEYKNSFIFVYSKIGKINAAIATFNLLINYNIKHLINIGTSGSISKDLNINDIVFCEKIFSYDIDLSIFGYKLGQLPKEKKNYYLSSIENIFLDSIKNKYKNIKVVSIASGDSFISKNNIKKFKIFDYENIFCVDMESFSISFICEKFNTNLSIIKIISDNIFISNQDQQFKNNFQNNITTIKNIISIILNE